MMKVILSGEPMFAPKGVLINRRATLGARVVYLRERIPALEKAARKTPPKTLKAEKEKVEVAKVELEKAKEDLVRSEKEWEELKDILGERDCLASISPWQK